MGLYHLFFGTSGRGKGWPKTPHCWRQYFETVNGPHGYTLASEWTAYNPAIWQPPIENLNPMMNPYHVPGLAGRLYDIRGRDVHNPDYDPRPKDYNRHNRLKVQMHQDEYPFFVALYEKALYAKANGIPYVPIEPKIPKRHHRKTLDDDGLSFIEYFESPTVETTDIKDYAQVPTTPDLSPSRSSSLHAESGSERDSEVSWRIPTPPKKYNEDFIDAEGKIHDIKEFNSEYLIAMIEKYEQSRLQAKANITAKKAFKQATKRAVGKVKSLRFKGDRRGVSMARG